MEQQGTVNNRTFVLLNFRSIIVATTIRKMMINHEDKLCEFRLNNLDLSHSNQIKQVEIIPSPTTCTSGIPSASLNIFEP